MNISVGSIDFGAYKIEEIFIFEYMSSYFVLYQLIRRDMK